MVILAAKKIEEYVNEVLKEKKFCILGVVGGRSAAKIFQNLNLSDKVHVFMVDERLVPIDDNESNFKIVKDNLNSGILHPFKGDIKEYEKELTKFQNYFDILFLSSGEDGHIGALYPNHHSINDDSEFFLTMDDSPKPPKKRMSASRKLILRSKKAVIVFVNKNKAFKMFNDDSLTYKECPAKLVKELDYFVYKD